MVKTRKTVKVITIDLDKCNGCRACEVACSSFHAEPRYSSNNPERARVRVMFDPVRDIYLPVFAGEYAKAECNGRSKYVINGKKYDECSFCGASCRSRGFFKEPDSRLPLKCDMCESDPTLEGPMCVQWCLNHALVYEEREEAAEAAEEAADELDLGLDSLVGKYGAEKLARALSRMLNRGRGGRAKLDSPIGDTAPMRTTRRSTPDAKKTQT